MLAYLSKRLALAIPTLLLVITLTFTLGYYAPGDPIVAMFGESMPPSPEAVEQLRRAYGLDRPYIVQLADYVQKAFRGDFGTSIALHREVTPAMRAALPISAQLGLAAFVLLMVIGIPISIVSATHHNTALDHLTVGATVVLNATPAFVLIPVILLIGVLKLELFSVPIGWHGLFSPQSILPVVVLAIGPLSWFVRTFRAAILEALSAQHVRTAHAKGITSRKVLWWHVIRNALPVGVSALALCVPGFFVGSFFVESIFAIPGFGRLSVQALQKYDYPLILGTAIVTAAVVIASNLLADVIAYTLDPGGNHD